MATLVVAAFGLDTFADRPPSCGVVGANSGQGVAEEEVSVKLRPRPSDDFVSVVGPPPLLLSPALVPGNRPRAEEDLVSEWLVD